MSHHFLISIAFFLTSSLDARLEYKPGDHIDVKCNFSKEAPTAEVVIEDRFKIESRSKIESLFFMEKVQDLAKDSVDKRFNFRMKQDEGMLWLAWKEKPHSRGSIWDIQVLLEFEPSNDYADQGPNAKLSVSKFAGSQVDPFISTDQYEGRCAIGVY